MVNIDPSCPSGGSGTPSSTPVRIRCSSAAAAPTHAPRAAAASLKRISRPPAPRPRARGASRTRTARSRRRRSKPAVLGCCRSDACSQGFCPASDLVPAVLSLDGRAAQQFVARVGYAVSAETGSVMGISQRSSSPLLPSSPSSPVGDVACPSSPRSEQGHRPAGSHHHSPRRDRDRQHDTRLPRRQFRLPLRAKTRCAAREEPEANIQGADRHAVGADAVVDGGVRQRQALGQRADDEGLTC